MLDSSAVPSSHSSQRSSEDRADPSRAASRVAGLLLLAIATTVLGSTALFVIGLISSGVTWTDGDEAYGAIGGDVSASLPPGVSHVVGSITGVAFFFGPVIIVPVTIAAAVLARRARRSGWGTDPGAVATVVVAAAWLVLIGFWGDELWVWALD